MGLAAAAEGAKNSTPRSLVGRDLLTPQNSNLCSPEPPQVLDMPPRRRPSAQAQPVVAEAPSLPVDVWLKITGVVEEPRDR